MQNKHSIHTFPEGHIFIFTWHGSNKRTRKEKKYKKKNSRDRRKETVTLTVTTSSITMGRMKERWRDTERRTNDAYMICLFVMKTFIFKMYTHTHTFT